MQVNEWNIQIIFLQQPLYVLKWRKISQKASKIDEAAHFIQKDVDANERVIAGIEQIKSTQNSVAAHFQFGTLPIRTTWET